ncbi:MAG: RNA-binding transcriptional accessory protein [Chlorobi bacterium]|nr:RNA-binding transcriptional accessory protein [Chlorobiota bacterium]
MPLDIINVLAEELQLAAWQVSNVIDLLEEGATIPFMARYRKERTGELDETQLRALENRYRYYQDLEDRKKTILQSIETQGKLNTELKERIESCRIRTELEDLYLPYRPKRRTRATIAVERGLEPLARRIHEQDDPRLDLAETAAPFVDAEKDVPDTEAALQGAADILAAEVAEYAPYRSYLREFIRRNGVLTSRVRKKFREEKTKFDTYRDYSVPLSRIQSHTLLALLRGEADGVLTLGVEYEREAVETYLEEKDIRVGPGPVRDFLAGVIHDALSRLLEPSIVTEVMKEQKEEADLEAVEVFGKNLRNVLLAPPAGMRPTIGIDPGYRTGCKVAVVDKTGRLLEHVTIYPTPPHNRTGEAMGIVDDLIFRHGIELIAIGNGTASRETEAFIDSVLAVGDYDPKPLKVIVSEAGASVYSASEAAAEEFPDLDVSIRGAVSIARRLQDPLAELVKIDPKSIGVGQYQHDVDQKLLKRKLDEVVESCVNFVGVNLNLASKELLSYVSGLNKTAAGNIVAYRDRHGSFRNREELLKVPRFGEKMFELSAGFLRIRNGDNPLDNTAVHPESYAIVRKMADDLGLAVEDLAKHPERVREIDLKRYCTDTVGLPTLKDIVEELLKPGRDPREEFAYASFREGIETIEDLKEGMQLEGVVTNVTRFGAFVDIGVHQDGLVHVSQLADRYVRDPHRVVHVGQIVKVTVLKVDLERKRIGLSMKSQPATEA